MSNLAHDFKNFARYFPSMPIHWVVLHYAKRHLKSHRRIPPDMAFMLTYVMWADKKYSDSQPRIPAGSPGGGQWTSGDGGGSAGDIISNPISAISNVSLEIMTTIEAECESQLESDLQICRSLGSASCYAQAMQRYGACLSGKIIPPFNF